MNTAKVPANASTPAEVILTVTTFRPVLAEKLGEIRNTDYTMRMKRPHRRVVIEDDTIYVKAPGASIRLIINSASKDPVRYYPAGITFVREDGERVSEALRLGRQDFLQRKIVVDGQALTFTDRFKKGKKNTLYKFSVIIQRGTDGAIGIIDPGIENGGGHKPPPVQL